jgi:type IV pilus assembly protein PilA
MSFLRKRLGGDEKGFTLIELLVVVIIIGILTAIAVPAYLSFRGKADESAAKSNVAAAVPVAEEYYDNADGGNGSYAGLGDNATQNLFTLEPSLNGKVTVASADASSYCIESTVNSETWHVAGPNGDPTTGACTSGT